MCLSGVFVCPLCALEGESVRTVALCRSDALQNKGISDPSAAVLSLHSELSSWCWAILPAITFHAGSATGDPPFFSLILRNLSPEPL